MAAEIDGLQPGAGFLLVVKDGASVELEGFSYDEPWPERIDEFRVFYWRTREDLAELG